MLDDKYRLDSLLEVGGMGAVYVGTHTTLKKKVAIKVLRRELAGSSDMIERFQREAVAASSIGHPSIVDVSDLGTTRDGSPFIVMEYLTGTTLAERIRQQGPSDPFIACSVIREILDAIAAAHQAGIIHRDLKPENVFLVRGTRGESIKILDFGISRVVEGRAGTASEVARLTATGQIMGTPYYMAPEQAAGQPDISGQVDVYAIGVMLYELLAGEVPFDAGNYNTIIFKVLSGEYPPLSTRPIRLPPGLEAVVTRAMALSPDDRFASAEEFAAALVPYASDALSPSQPIPLSAVGGDRATTIGMAATMTPADLARLPSAVISDTRFGHSGLAQGPGPGATFGPTLEPSRHVRKFALIAAALVLIGGAIAATLWVGASRQQGGGQVRAEDVEASNEPRIETGAGLMAVALPDALPQRGDAIAAGDDATVGNIDEQLDTSARSSEVSPQITLTFEVKPRDAEIRVDGKRVKDRTLTISKSDREVELRVRRRGYQTKRRVLRLDQNRVVEVLLERKTRRGTDNRATGSNKRIIGDSPYD